MADTTPKYKFGQHEFDVDLFKLNLGDNVQSFIEYQDWTPYQKQLFMDSYNEYVANLTPERFSTDDFGTITDQKGVIDDTHTWAIDASGNEYSEKDTTTGKRREKKAAAKYNAGKLDFNPYQQLAIFANSVGNALKSKLTSSTLKSTKTKFNGLGYGLKYEYFTPTNNDVDFFNALLDKEARSTDFNRVSALLQYLQKGLDNIDTYEFDSDDDKTLWTSRFLNAINALSDGTYNTDDLLDLRYFFDTDYLKNYFSTEKLSLLTDEQKQLQQAANTLKAWSDYLTQDFLKSNAVVVGYGNYELNDTTPALSGKLPPKVAKLAETWFETGNDELKTTNPFASPLDSPEYRILSGLLAFLYYIYDLWAKRNTDYGFCPVDTDTSRLLNYYYPKVCAAADRLWYYPIGNQQYALVYNSNTGKLFKIYAGFFKTSGYYLNLKAAYGNGQSVPTFNKEGGVIEQFQHGGKPSIYQNDWNEYQKQFAAQQQQLEAEKQEQSAKQNSNTSQSAGAWGYNYDGEEMFDSWEDFARIGAVIADGAAMFTKGTTSFGAGIAGTTIQAAADFSDVSKGKLGYGHAIANTGIGLLSDVGAAFGLKQASQAKLLPIISRYLPKLFWLATALELPHAVIKTVQSDPAHWDEGDWNNALYLIRVGLACHKRGITTRQLNRFKEFNLKSNKIGFETTNGQRIVVDGDAGAIASRIVTSEKSTELKVAELNALLKNFGLTNGNSVKVHTAGRSLQSPIGKWNSETPRASGKTSGHELRSPLKARTEISTFIPGGYDMYRVQSPFETSQGTMNTIEYVKSTPEFAASKEGISKANAEFSTAVKSAGEAGKEERALSKLINEAKTEIESLTTNVQNGHALSDYEKLVEALEKLTLRRSMTSQAHATRRDKVKEAKRIGERRQELIDEFNLKLGITPTTSVYEDLLKMLKSLKLGGSIRKFAPGGTTSENSINKKTPEELMREHLTGTLGYDENATIPTEWNNIVYGDVNWDNYASMKPSDWVKLNDAAYNEWVKDHATDIAGDKFINYDNFINLLYQTLAFKDYNTYLVDPANNYANLRKYLLDIVQSDKSPLKAKNHALHWINPQGEWLEGRLALIQGQANPNEDLFNDNFFTIGGETFRNVLYPRMDKKGGTYHYTPDKKSPEQIALNYKYNPETLEFELISSTEGLTQLNTDPYNWIVNEQNPNLNPGNYTVNYWLDATRDPQSEKVPTSNTINGNGKGSSTAGVGTQKSTEKSNKSSFNWNNLARISPNFIALGRVFDLNRSSDKIADLMMASKKPFLKDPLEKQRFIYGDLRATQEGQQAAAEYQRQVATPITSDGSLQTATLFEALQKGQKAIEEGNTKDDAMIRKTSELALNQAHQNQENRWQVAMENRLQQNKTVENKANIDLARLSEKTKNWDTFGQTLEYEARTKINKKKDLLDAFIKQSIQNDIYNNAKDYLENDQEALNVWNKYYNNSFKLWKNATDSELTALSRARSILEQQIQSKLANYYGVYYSPIEYGKRGYNAEHITDKVRESDQLSPTDNKEGGVLNYEKLSSFMKSGGTATVRAAKIKAKTKNADRMSKSVQELLKLHWKKLERLSKSMYKLPNKA